MPCKENKIIFMVYRSWYKEVAEAHFEELYNGGLFVSSRVAMHIITRGKTVAAEFMVWFKENWPSFANPSTGRLSSFQEEVKVKDTSVSDQDKTWTDERSGTVFTDLGEYGIISFTQGEFRSIKRDYSKHYGGKALSKSEITIRYNFPTPHAFDIFRRIHFLYQNGIPFTDREIEEEGVETLVEKSIESKRQKFMLDLSSREHEQVKRDAEKWRAFEVNAELIAREVRGAATGEVSFIGYTEASTERYAVVLPMQDLHIGKRSVFGGQCTYDRKEAVRRATAATQDLMTQALRQGGRPERIFLVVGGDLMHFDNSSLLTSSLKTSQGGQSDGSYREVMSETTGMVVGQVKMLRAIAPVSVLVVHGNHDRQSMLFLGLLLEQAFAGDEAVKVVMQNEGGYTFVNYGDTSLMALHGENMKEKDAYRIIANAAEEVGVPLQKNKLMLTGHFHTAYTVDLNGVLLHRCASLSEADQWHRDMHYSGARIEAEALLVRREGGRSAILYSDPKCLKVA